VTFAGLSEETGLPVEMLMVIREVTGSAQPQPDDRLREDELLIVPFLRFAMGSGVGHEGVERLLRVYGDNLRRVAETEADWWHTELMPVLGTDADPAELLEAADRLPSQATDWSDQAVLAIYHAQQAHAWTKSMIETVESALEEAGLHSRLERVPAISFLDISGYTRLTEERGDAAAAGLAENLTRMVQRISVRHGGEPVKRLGDGVMLHYPEPGAGVLSALEMVDGVAEAGLPPAHVGVHAGPVLFQDGDYYGRTVNVAARIADYARPGEVLVSQAVLDASDQPGVAYTEVGPVELKGVAEPTRLWTARRQD
jgi:class 3 adenylate cyclase